MTEDHTGQDEDMNFGLTIPERDTLFARLRELPDTVPPRAVWQRIEAQARAEGLLQSRRLPAGARWFGGAGLAAAVVLAVLNLPNAANRGLPEQSAEAEVFPTVPEYSESADPASAVKINALMVQSQLLERDLRALPNQPRVMRAGTTATIADLQDRIAAIDYQLSSPASRMTAGEQEIFWRERVRLMDSLVRLRYAQAQRVSF